MRGNCKFKSKLYTVGEVQKGIYQMNIRLKLFLFSLLISISCVVSAQLQTVSSNLSLDYLYDGKTTDLTVSYRATNSFSDSEK